MMFASQLAHLANLPNWPFSHLAIGHWPIWPLAIGPSGQWAHLADQPSIWRGPCSPYACCTETALKCTTNRVCQGQITADWGVKRAIFTQIVRRRIAAWKLLGIIEQITESGTLLVPSGRSQIIRDTEKSINSAWRARARFLIKSYANPGLTRVFVSYGFLDIPGITEPAAWQKCYFFIVI